MVFLICMRLFSKSGTNNSRFESTEIWMRPIGKFGDPEINI
jgi:hypothetical protein